MVAPQKDAELEGHRILVVHPVDPDGTMRSSSLLALDKVDAGEGDLVLVNREGGGARIALQNERIPVQAVIVAVVDRVEVRGR